ncbi:MAG: hypothetical protein JNM93_12230 [Bacteriovoracaceae bacterium]|nr:hypothetical protein [Bacteriovoracaceae bacterium]
MAKKLSIKTKALMTLSLMTLCLITLACSSDIYRHDYLEVKAGKNTSNVKANWFNNRSPHYSAQSLDNGVLPHYFFDPNPNVNVAQSSLNFIPVTPIDSKIRYNIDTLSGQIYSEIRYCAQDDVYKKFPGQVTTPPYTMGIVPRIINQVGEPQQIIVFGNDERYTKPEDMNSSEVRVVGGIIEQVCLLGSCQNQKSWISQMTLVAVDAKDPDFQYIFDLVNLKNKVNWEKVKAFFLNGRGRNYIGDKAFPAFRYKGEIRADQAMLFIGSHGHEFHEDELKRMKLSCHKLYDHVWEKLGNPESTDFLKQFQLFAQKFTKEFQTCTRYVKYSNINTDYERHWFFTHIAAFMDLYKLGYYYNCDNGMWGSNPVDENGKNIYGVYKEVIRCNERKLDSAFPQAIFFLRNLQRFEKEYYRYITYDELPFGTHHKIYSFVKTSAKKLACESKEFEKINVSYDIFPEDISWNKLPQALVNKKAKDKDDIIK